jgi:hypothetical protein
VGVFVFSVNTARWPITYPHQKERAEMNAKQVNPETAPDDELVALEGAATPEPTSPTPEQEPAVPRRSRRELWRRIAEAAEAQEKREADEADQAGKLAEIAKSEAFIAYQRQQDAQLQQERARAALLERQMQDRAMEERRQRLAVLESAMDDDELDSDDRRAARQEYITLATQDYADGMRRWEEYKRGEIVSHNLDPNDTRFSRQYSPGDAGLAEFQADLTAAENAKLRKELAAAKATAATPESIAELVRKELAALLASQGFDTVDLGEPAGASSNEDAWERDLTAFQSGTMSPAAYTKKWGRK